MDYDPRTLKSGAHLSAFDPASGKLTATRSFPADGLPINGSLTGYILRQRFNADFSAEVAQGPVAADGSTSAGITDASGLYKPLTAATSGGYGSPPVKAPLAFNPVTGRLWYRYTDAASNYSLLGSVDPQVGASSERQEFLDRQTSPVNAQLSFPNPNGTVAWGYFAADGFGPINPFAAGAGRNELQDIVLPGGTEVYGGENNSSQPADNAGFQVGKEGTLDYNGPFLPVTTQKVGLAKLPVSNDSFVAFGGLSARTQLYLCTIGATQITAVPLLPPSNRLIQDVALDPTGTKLAFVSTAGQVTTLYTVDLTGAHQLATVGEVAVPSGDAVQVRVLAWN